MVNIVSFNGGRGAKNLIPAFLEIDGINLTSIVNAYDDGKSTGELRKFFKMLGPSDIRKVQEAMVPEDIADFKNIIRAYDFRYGDSADHDLIIAGLHRFASNKTDELEGINFIDKTIRESLRVFILKLITGIELIEKSENKRISFSDCSIMNLIYAGAFLFFGGNFEDATIFIDKLFKLKGTVLPTNNEDKKLVAIREDGTILLSEAEIVELRANSRIKKIYLLDQYPDRDILTGMPVKEVEEYFEIMNRQVTITSKVERSISDADVIIYSAGTQHSSLYPSYMTKGLTDAIVANKKALKIFITNIGEDYETPEYTANDFINGAIRYLKMGSQFNVAVTDIIDIALVNNRFSNNLENYVKYDLPDLEKIGCKVIVDAFEDVHSPGKHDGKMLADYIISLYNNSYNLNYL
jgi:2-phospho-L-lactate transferase/gluconeogenesis factor (CofD/UPF0052 family)